MLVVGRGKKDPITLPRVHTGELNLYYELSGPEGAPVVCLNHCFTSDHRYWDVHMPAFQGFQVLRFDARGHGDSDTPPGPYSLEMMARDLRELCDALQLDQVHVCGVSLGGQVAQTFALEYPERVNSLVLVNTTCEYDKEQTQAWRQRAATALDQGMSVLHESLLARWFTEKAAEQRIPGYVYMESVVTRMSAAAFHAGCAAMCMLNTTARLPAINAPTLIIATPDDPGAPRAVSEKMAALIPHCELHWLEPARHLSSLEHPLRFNQLVRAFMLKRKDSAPTLDT